MEKSTETMNYTVVGVTFEGRQDILNEFYRSYKVGGSYGVRLVNEDGNPYDANAVAVHLETEPGTYRQVGYLSRDVNVTARSMARRLASAKLRSIGPNRKWQIGLTVDATYNI